MNFENQYLPYENYVELGGKMEKAPFNILEFDARRKVDIRTRGRLVNLKEQNQCVKMCIFKLIDEIKKYNESDDGISSETVGSYSVHYDKKNTKEQQKKYNDIIDEYLSDCKLSNGIPYLYLG